jgi:glycosyltransferase involved in cell wall biosynthesis
VRKLYFLVPGTGGKFAYRQREKGTPFLDDLLKEKNLDNFIFVISWGFDVAKLAARLKDCHVVYHAHSAGYGFTLPAAIPIVTVSRNTLGYWGQRSPHSLIYYLPNQISDEFRNLHRDRDIDVLIQKRKSSDYLLNQLIPALQKRCNVKVIDSYVEDLAGIFNRAKVYLYDSAEYWAMQGVSEGFGLQPMEALACGCQVFSSVNGGLSDYLDPGFNCYKIAGYATEYDVERILDAIARPKLSDRSEDFFAEYRTDNIVRRLTVILNEIDRFFDGKQQYISQIKSLTKMRIWQLNVRRTIDKIGKKFF